MTEDMVKIMKSQDKVVIEMFKKCVEEEKAWARHLFKDGSIIGLNERLLGQYVEHIANKRLKALGFDLSLTPRQHRIPCRGRHTGYLKRRCKLLPKRQS
jgi:ribonucleotide reductase beta subunit family protein with ferritin-like domain